LLSTAGAMRFVGLRENTTIFFLIIDTKYNNIFARTFSYEFKIYAESIAYIQFPTKLKRKLKNRLRIGASAEFCPQEILFPPTVQRRAQVNRRIGPADSGQGDKSVLFFPPFTRPSLYPTHRPSGNHNNERRKTG